MVKISPQYDRADFLETLSMEDKITIFEDRVKGWQLDMAQLCIDHSEHAGFAVLHIATSYFEMIARFESGDLGSNTSKTFFKRGLQMVLPEFHRCRGEKVQQVVDILWKEVRCGLYHNGITGPKTVLSGGFGVPVALAGSGHLQVNPGMLVTALQHHFGFYVGRLRDGQNVELRDKFERRFDYEPKSQVYRDTSQR